jgi:hypothetical protein
MMFRDWDLSPSSGKKPTQLGPINRASPYLQTPKAIQGRNEVFTWPLTQLIKRLILINVNI